MDRWLKLLGKRIERHRLKQERHRQWEEPQAIKAAMKRPPKAERPLCGPQWEPYKARAVAYSTRCRMHGGLSTGPTTEAELEAIWESNRRNCSAERSGRIDRDDIGGVMIGAPPPTAIRISPKQGQRILNVPGP